MLAQVRSVLSILSFVAPYALEGKLNLLISILAETRIQMPLESGESRNKSGLVFGPKVAKQYGSDTTLWSGLQGGGDPLSALLREAITAILNIYNSINGLPYNSLQVVDGLNSALSEPTDNRTILIAALT